MIGSRGWRGAAFGTVPLMGLVLLSIGFATPAASQAGNARHSLSLSAQPKSASHVAPGVRRLRSRSPNTDTCTALLAPALAMRKSNSLFQPAAREHVALSTAAQSQPSTALC